VDLSINEQICLTKAGEFMSIAVPGLANFISGDYILLAHPTGQSEMIY